MAITVKHKFVSAIPDGTDATVVRPSNWNDDHDLTGTIPVANGGTGAATANGAITNLLPSQTGNNGKVLSTDGTNTSWAAAGGTGTVTSVTGTSPVSVATGTTTPVISLAASYGDTQNPYASKTANYVLAAPNGSAGVPTFRALVNSDVTGLGTMSTQNANAVAVTGGTVNGTTIGATTASTGAFTYISTSSSTSTTPTLSFNASNSPYAAGATISGSYLQHLLQNKSGTAGASTNYVLSNDLGTDSTYYGEFGMNSSVYSSGTPADFFSLNNGIYYSGHDGDITIGSGNGYKTYLAWGTTGQSAHVINVTGAIGLNTNITGTTNFGTAGQVLTSGGSTATPTWTTPTSGTVTSVTGTAPVVSSGGSTPAISIPAATTSVSGYLTFTDWNTFNNKGSGTVTSVSGTTGRITSTGGATPVIDLASGVATAGTTGSSTLIPVVTIDTYGRVTSITTASNPQGTVTSVTGTAPVVSSGGATPAISMAAATTSVNGYLTSTDWTTFNGKYSVGGALGTPSSGTVTNLTGTASININGTIGATTANTGAFTTVSASGVITSTIATGTAPFTVASTTQVANLNAATAGTAAALSATLVATSGGTGQSTYAVGDLLVGGATNTLTKLADVATGNSLISGGVGVAPSWGKIGLTTHVSGTLPVANGGTNLTSYAVGDIVYASGTGTLASLADVATGNAIISGGVGVAPSYGKVGLTTHVSGTLPIANGGTNATTASITSFNNITGYTASGATGTTSTNLVFSTAPTVTNPTLTGFIETVYAVTGTTPALSPTNGTIQTWTLSGSSTPTAGTWTAGASLSLQITASTNTITWSSMPVTWMGGTAPTLSTTVTTNIELWKIGSTIYGALVGLA